jgi:ABC-2 type transport system permease protein
MVVATCAVTGYATLVLLLFFRPESILVVFLGLASTGIAYGALGFVLAVLVRGELEGFFVIIMVSLIDTFMQNPVGNPWPTRTSSLISPRFEPPRRTLAAASPGCRGRDRASWRPRPHPASR